MQIGMKSRDEPTIETLFELHVSVYHNIFHINPPIAKMSCLDLEAIFY